MSEQEIQILWLSIKIATVSSLGCFPLALAMGWLLGRREFWGKSLLDALVHLPLVVPPVVVGYGLLLLLGRHGPIGAFLERNFDITLPFTWQGAAIASAVMAFPLMVRVMRLAIEQLDPALDEAAKTLGAPAIDRFTHIALPLLRPALLSAIILGFARSLGEFGATITFAANIPGETQTLPLAIYNALQNPTGEALAGRLTILSLACALGAIILGEWLARQQRKQKAAGRGIS